ncbi:uncharacterized protein LOC116948350 [Petromyzon marinus]|uniref:uncharacterized protein LOC116948350 n=1 Tax=Petromyzon marinus TaxID=7757 RepID=UPI003F7126E8
MTMIHQTEERGPAVALPVSPSLRNGDLPSAKKRSRRKVIMNRLQAKGSKRPGCPESIEIQPVRDRGGGRRSSLGGGGTAASAGRAAPMSAKELYVKHVVDELVETEKTYVANLRSIIEDYLSVIIDRKALPLTRGQVYTLFGNIEYIYPFNSDLLQSLEACAGDVVAIANCFVLKSEDFKIYTQYCTNYPSSMAILSDCMKNKTLVAFFRERQTALRHSLPLGSYLLKPVQRILKYHLFLKDIASRLDNGAEGRDVVNRALAAMHGVARSINEMKRKHEHAIRAQEIQGLLVCGKARLNLDELGELVQEGTFQVKHGRKERTLFLFAKALLVTKRREDGTFTHKSCINCDNLMMSENTKERTFSVWNQRDPKTRITFQTKSLNEQRLWTLHLKKLILKSHPTVVPERAMQVILDVNLLADQNTPEGKPEATTRRPSGNTTSDSPSPPLPPHDLLRPAHWPSRESPRWDIVRRPSRDSADPGSPWSPGGHGGQGAPAGTTPPSLRRDAGGRGSASASLRDRGRSSGEGSSEETAAAAAGVTPAMTPRADEVASRAPLGPIDVGHSQGFTTAQCPAEPTVPSPAREMPLLKDDTEGLREILGLNHGNVAASPLPTLRPLLSPRCRQSLSLAYNNKGTDSDQVAITESSGEDLEDDDDDDDDDDDNDDGDDEEFGGGVEMAAVDWPDRYPTADVSARELSEARDVSTLGSPSSRREGDGTRVEDGGGDAGKRGRDSAPPLNTLPGERASTATTAATAEGKEALATPTSTNPSSASSRRSSTEEGEETVAEQRRLPLSPRSPAKVLANAAGRPKRGARADDADDRVSWSLPDATELNGFPCPLPAPMDRPSEPFGSHANGYGIIEEEVEEFLEGCGGDDSFAEEFDVKQACGEPRPLPPHLLNQNGGGNGVTSTESEWWHDFNGGVGNGNGVSDGGTLARATSRGQTLQLSRASSLSKKDRQLIEKIKNYYDREGCEDAQGGAAPVKRRESLAHIPQGKVRNSIFVRAQQLQKIKRGEENGAEPAPAPAGLFGFPADVPDEGSGAAPGGARAAGKTPSPSRPGAEAFDVSDVQAVYDNWVWPPGGVYDNLLCLGSSSALPPLPTLQEKPSEGEEENVYGEVDLDAAFPPDAAQHNGDAASPRRRPAAINQGGGALPPCDGHGAQPADCSKNLHDLCDDLESYYRDHGKVASGLAAFPVAELDLESPPRSLSAGDVGASLAELPAAAREADGGGGASFARLWRKKLGRLSGSGGGGSGKGAAGEAGGGASRGPLGRSLCSSEEAISAEGERRRSGGAGSPARRARSMYDVDSPPTTPTTPTAATAATAARFPADKSKSRVYTLAREYSMRIKRTRPVTGAREGSAEVAPLPAVLEMNAHNSGTIGARMAEHMHTYGQIIIREGNAPPMPADLDPQPPTAASGRRRLPGTPPPTSPARSPLGRPDSSPDPSVSSRAGSRSPSSATPPGSPSRGARPGLPADAPCWPVVRGLRLRYQGGAGGSGGDSDRTRVVSPAKSTGNLATARVRWRGDAGGSPAPEGHGPSAAPLQKPRIWSWNGPDADWLAPPGDGGARRSGRAATAAFDRRAAAPLGPRRAKENYHRNFVDNDDDGEDYVEIRSPDLSGPQAVGTAAETPRAAETGGGDDRTRSEGRSAGDGGRGAPAVPGHRAQGSSERSLVRKLKERFQPLSYQSHA